MITEIREMYTKVVNGEITMSDFEDWVIIMQLTERDENEPYFQIH